MRVIAFLFLTINLMASDILPDRHSQYLVEPLLNGKSNLFFIYPSNSEIDFLKSKGVIEKVDGRYDYSAVPTIPKEVQDRLTKKYHLGEMVESLRIEWDDKHARVKYAVQGEQGLEDSIQKQIISQAVIYETAKSMIAGLVEGNSCSPEQAKNLDQIINRYLNLEQVTDYLSTKRFINPFGKTIFHFPTNPLEVESIDYGQEFTRSEQEFLDESLAEIFDKLPISQITWSDYTTNPNWFDEHFESIKSLFNDPTIANAPKHWKLESRKFKKFKDGQHLTSRMREHIQLELDARCTGIVFGEDKPKETAKDHSGRRPAVEMIGEKPAYNDSQIKVKKSI